MYPGRSAAFHNQRHMSAWFEGMCISRRFQAEVQHATKRIGALNLHGLEHVSLVISRMESHNPHRHVTYLCMWEVVTQSTSTVDCKPSTQINAWQPFSINIIGILLSMLDMDNSGIS